MSSNPDDVVPVQNTLVLLRRLRCPDVRLGQGTDLFQQDASGRWPLTPDIVAGPFYGADDPHNFYIDVVAPTGAYMFVDKAGASSTATMLREAVGQRGTFSREDIPPEFARPLTGSLRSKASKYSGGVRAGSPLFGLVAYFCDRAEYGGAVFASLAYLRALDLEFGGVPHQEIMERLLPAESSVAVRVSVSWDVPICLVIYARRLVNDDFACAILANAHARLTPHRDHPVVAWTLGA